MKVMIIGPKFFNYTSSTENAFKKLGCQTIIETYLSFYDQCNYFEKKLNNWGIAPLSERYYNDWNKKILYRVETFNPDAVVVLNGQYLSVATLVKIKDLKIKLVLWMVDSIQRFPEMEKLICFYDLFYSFDSRDEIFVLQKYNRLCSYLPVGYDPEIYSPGLEQIQDIDICFVGNATKNRIEVLKRVAEYARVNNINFLVYGKYWNERYFWKKKYFVHKYRPLNLYVKNKNLEPHEVAALYRRSKICLNIHIDAHQGVNPRTFEIMGTRSMELVDFKPRLDKMVDVGKDLVVYSNTDINDLIKKIDYYLKNIILRKSIANSGHDKVYSRYTILNSAQVIFNSINNLYVN